MVLLRYRITYWELKEEAEDENDSLSIKHKREIQIIFLNSMEPLKSTLLNNNNDY